MLHSYSLYLFLHLLQATLESEASPDTEKSVSLRLSAVLECLRRVICGLPDFVPSYLERMVPLLLHPKMQSNLLAATVEKLFGSVVKVICCEICFC